jgi:hypothetical protein
VPRKTTGVVFRACWLLCVIHLSYCTRVAGQESGDGEKQPIPAAAARDAALRTVRDIFREDIDGARTPEQKSTLAAKLQ